MSPRSLVAWGLRPCLKGAHLCFASEVVPVIALRAWGGPDLIAEDDFFFVLWTEGRADVE